MKQPWYLTVWLLTLVIFDLSSLIIYTTSQNYLRPVLPQIPVFVFYLYALIAAIELFGLYFLWKWKLSGFYVLLFTALIALFLNTIYLGITISAFGLLGIAILYLVMKPVWEKFK